MQAAQFLVEIAETGRDARGLAAALIGRLGDPGGIGQGFLERLEAAFGGTLGRQIEQLLFGHLDLLARIEVDILLERLVDDVAADFDQLAAEMQIVDLPAIIGGIDDGDDRGGELRQIARPADVGQRAVLLEERLQRDGTRDLAALDQLFRRLVDALMDWFEEIIRAQEFRDPVISRVIDQQRAQKRLFGFEVLGRRAVGGRVRRSRDGRDRAGGIHVGSNLPPTGPARHG